MAVDEKTLKALDLKNLPLPPKPVVEAIEVQPYVDTTGEESLDVWVVLSDATDDDDLTGKNVMQINAAIRESLLECDIRLFPYVHLIKQSDYRSQMEGE